MSYPICRVRKITSIEQLNTAEEHNARLYEERGKIPPENIRPEREGILGFSDYEQAYDGPTLAASILSRLESLGIKPRKNSVLAHEYILGVSKDWYEKADYNPQGMLTNLIRFLGGKYGPENIACVAFHFDESTPHAHVICIPVVTKEHRWKNRNGEGVQVKASLSGSDFIDGKDTLIKLQDDFHEYACQWDRNGATIFRGLKAEETKKQYTEKTNHLLGDLRDVAEEIKRIKDQIDKQVDLQENTKRLLTNLQKHQELTQQVASTQTKIAGLEKSIKHRKEKNENGGWKKGMDFNNM